MKASRAEIDNLSFRILGAAIEVHRQIGPGLLESVYQKCLAIEFFEREISFKQELEIPIVYKGHTVEGMFKCDFFIEDLVVVELKAVSEILPVHQAQVINYMNLLRAPKGILLNFNVTNLFKQGQKTFVNKYY
ncbi:GxxExxY protein [Algoriphagus boseongensis]|uniref:GxxExxY protein n=1 Tax=Algoriphagus boseongensis TaxID=1442587 RepID=A0A4R6T332_9BACT|nr:GxxExxY protein [Algoriphagus boseongensis]TDQ14598.1 GxxExxY protein [Algoriphagus boseongensis]